MSMPEKEIVSFKPENGNRRLALTPCRVKLATSITSG